MLTPYTQNLVTHVSEFRVDTHQFDIICQCYILIRIKYFESFYFKYAQN